MYLCVSLSLSPSLSVCVRAGLAVYLHVDMRVHMYILYILHPGTMAALTFLIFVSSMHVITMLHRWRSYTNMC